MSECESEPLQSECDQNESFSKYNIKQQKQVKIAASTEKTSIIDKQYMQVFTVQFEDINTQFSSKQTCGSASFLQRIYTMRK